MAINCKKTENMVSASETTESKLRIGDISIKQIKNFKCIVYVLTEDVKCVAEIRTPTGLEKVASQKMKKNKKQEIIEAIYQYSMDDLPTDEQKTAGLEM